MNGNEYKKKTTGCWKWKENIKSNSEMEKKSDETCNHTTVKCHVDQFDFSK